MCRIQNDFILFILNRNIYIAFLIYFFFIGFMVGIVHGTTDIVKILKFLLMYTSFYFFKNN